MSKFDNIIAAKLGHLSEAAPNTPGSMAQPGQPSAQTQPTAQPNQQQGQQPDQQQTQQPQQQGQPGDALANAFKSLKFGDANTAVKSFNDALKTAGNVPGMKEFFSSLAYDPQKGFLIAQQQAQQAQQPQAAQTAPNAAPLK